MSESAAQIPPMFALLVGINEYKEFDHLKRCVGDVHSIETFLTTKWKIPQHNITTLIDAEATKERIIKELSSLPDKPGFVRNNAILFFFSGYAGISRSGGSEVGIICPVDITRQQGAITDAMLIQLFDQIAKSGGNNITAFLDCASNKFAWGNPSSFVVVGPTRATESEEGGAFTKFLLQVLGSEKRLELLTVQSLADKIQADMGGVTVQCYGQNVDRLVFNPEAGEAYHAFTTGYTGKDGSITLSAGLAHGVQKDATYGIYLSNVIADENTIRGYLMVNSVNDDFSATLRFPAETFSLPPVFYAVETRCPEETVNIFFPDASIESTHISTICPFPSWKKVETIKEANITLRNVGDEISFSWNGVTGDHEPEHMRKTELNDDTPIAVNKDFIRTVRNAARFTYHVSRSSPSNSSVSGGLSVNLQEIDMVTEKITGEDILNGGFAELKLSKDKRRGPFCLTLNNSNNFAVWPFIFICEAETLDIFPWYMPQLGSKEPPLKANDKLVVGCGREDGLAFGWSSGHKVDITYIKIFVARDRTDFSSIMQRYDSVIEDKLRDTSKTSENASPERSSVSTGMPHSPSIGNQEGILNIYSSRSYGRRLGGFKPPSKWAAMRLTIVQKYVDQSEEN